jgi:hypothetical protein
MDQGRQERDEVDAAAMLLIRRQCRLASVSCARLQSCQLPADACAARNCRTLVADQPAREARQDRCQDRTHARYVTFQMGEVAVPRELFKESLSLIDRLRIRPARHRYRDDAMQHHHGMSVSEYQKNRAHCAFSPDCRTEGMVDASKMAPPSSKQTEKSALSLSTRRHPGNVR